MAQLTPRGYTIPDGTDPISAGDDLLRANFTQIDAEIGGLAAYCHIEGGGADIPSSTSTAMTGHTSAYGQPWANLSAGTITVPAAGVYQITGRAALAVPGGAPTDYDVNFSIRDASSSLFGQWTTALKFGVGATTHTAGCALHLPAGAELRAAVYLAGYTSTASQAVLSVRLVEAD